jgi:hypothetical protein
LGSCHQNHGCGDQGLHVGAYSRGRRFWQIGIYWAHGHASGQDRVEQPGRRDWHRFFFSPILAVSPSFQSTSYTVVGKEAQSVSSPGLNLHVRLSTGFNSRHLFLVGDFYADRFDQDTETIQVGASIYGILFSIGARF